MIVVILEIKIKSQRDNKIYNIRMNICNFGFREVLTWLIKEVWYS